MLIEIRTIEKPEDYIKPYTAFINPDRIVDVTDHANGSVLIDMGYEGCRHTVSSQEFARIKPFLVAELSEPEYEFRYLVDPAATALEEYVNDSWDIAFESHTSFAIQGEYDQDTIENTHFVRLRREKPAVTTMEFQSAPVPQSALDAINDVGNAWDARQKARFEADNANSKARLRLAELWGEKNAAYNAYQIALSDDYAALDRYKNALEAYADAACGYIAQYGMPLSVPLDERV